MATTSSQQAQRRPRRAAASTRRPTALPGVGVLADTTPQATRVAAELARLYRTTPAVEAETLIVIGGDGFMLRILRAILERSPNAPQAIYGINAGTVGFLMNEWRPEGLAERLENAEATVLHPLRMTATFDDGTATRAYAINDVSITRAGPQTSKLEVSVSGIIRIEELVGDGILVATPAGSTGYNLSARGPIIPIGAGLLALTPICPFRPRRWPGALLPSSAVVAVEVLEAAKRPVVVTADGAEFHNPRVIEVLEDRSLSLRALFDPGHALEARIVREMFDT